MADYRLELTPAAERDLESLPPTPLARVKLRLARLVAEPRGFGTEKLSGADTYRARVGDYRIVYAVSDARRLVLIVRVRHRRDAYRPF